MAARQGEEEAGGERQGDRMLADVGRILPAGRETLPPSVHRSLPRAYTSSSITSDQPTEYPQSRWPRVPRRQRSDDRLPASGPGPVHRRGRSRELQFAERSAASESGRGHASRRRTRLTALVAPTGSHGRKDGPGGRTEAQGRRESQDLPRGFRAGTGQPRRRFGPGFPVHDARDGSGAISHIVDGIGGQNVDKVLPAGALPVGATAVVGSEGSTSRNDLIYFYNAQTGAGTRVGLDSNNELTATSGTVAPGCARRRRQDRRSVALLQLGMGATATGEVGSKGPVMQRAFPAGTLPAGLTHLVAVSPHDSLKLSLTKTRIFGYNQRTGSAVVVGFSDLGVPRP